MEQCSRRVTDDIRTHSFDSAQGTYTGAFGSAELDAAVLLPVLEFEPPTSPRLAGTIPGREGAFLPCSFWLVQALARTGRHDEAAALFGELLTLGGPLGLYGEEMDPTTAEHLGNFPQALTHAAVVQAALALSDATADVTQRRRAAR